MVRTLYKTPLNGARIIKNTISWCAHYIKHQTLLALGAGARDAGGAARGDAAWTAAPGPHGAGHAADAKGAAERPGAVAESQPWSGAEWAVTLRFDNPRSTLLVRLLG